MENILALFPFEISHQQHSKKVRAQLHDTNWEAASKNFHAWNIILDQR
jgi:hypothetical protein